MRRPLMVALLTFCVLCGALAAISWTKFRAAERRSAEIERREAALHDRYATALGSIAAIQDSLNALAMGEEALALEAPGARGERLLATGDDPVLERIAELRGSVDLAKDRIGELDASLRSSGLRLGSLELGIERMKRTVASRDVRIADLRRQVDSLESTVTGLLADAETLRRELGTVLVAAGTRRELTEAGVVVAEGGILGIGRTLRPSGKVDDASFVPIDTDVQKTIFFHAGHAEVLSAQPVSSYRIETIGDQVRLHILDAHEFRKVKHLVIVTT